MCQEYTDRSFVEHYQTSNSSAIDMWIQSDSCVICFPLVFFCRSLSQWALLYKQEHMWHSGMSNQRGSYISVWLSAHLVLSLLLETADILWPDRIFRTKPSYLGQICFTEFELPSEANILNWPTKNLVEDKFQHFLALLKITRTEACIKQCTKIINIPVYASISLSNVVKLQYLQLIKYQVDSNRKISSLQSRFTRLGFGQSDKNKIFIQLTTKLSGNILQSSANHALNGNFFRKHFFLTILSNEEFAQIIFEIKKDISSKFYHCSQIKYHNTNMNHCKFI